VRFTNLNHFSFFCGKPITNKALFIVSSQKAICDYLYVSVALLPNLENFSYELSF
jgi:hypothetical protein